MSLRAPTPDPDQELSTGDLEIQGQADQLSSAQKRAGRRIALITIGGTLSAPLLGAAALKAGRPGALPSIST